MDKEDLNAVIPLLSEQYDPEWQKKLVALVSRLSRHSDLEIIGKLASYPQILTIVDRCQDKDKLGPLFVGMNHSFFLEVLMNATPDQLAILKHESITEPIQHHLTLLIHEFLLIFASAEAQLKALENEIAGIDLKQISGHEILEYREKIKHFELYHHHLLEKINRCLAIAWNTNRQDLIEKFNVIKDQCQKVLKYLIGQPKTDSEQSVGLYGSLEKLLDSVYADPDHPESVESLKDSEPAIEALVKLSVWYLQDYWEIGLLPAVQTREELSRPEIREKLFHDVENNLSKLGLHRVMDLKEANIYSKKTLIDYIYENRQKIL